MRADPEDLVLPVTVVGEHQQVVAGPVDHLADAPVLAQGVGGADPLEPAAVVELHEEHALVLQHRDGQGAAQRAPLLADHEGRAAGGDGRVAGGPPGLALLAGQGLVGHRHRLVVAGHGVPAVVTALDQLVDLVVAVAAVLDRPQRAVGALGEPLHVAVAVGEDVALLLVARLHEGVPRPGVAGAAVQAQHLAAQGGQVAGVGADGGVAGADQQRAVTGHQQPTAAVAARGGGQALEQHAAALGLRAAVVQPPRDHAHVVPTVLGGGALAGPEAAVAAYLRVHREPHQPGLPGDPDGLRGEVHTAYVAVLPDRDRGPVALGEQQAPTADGLDVPGVVEPVGDHLDVEPGHGPAARWAAAGRGVGRARLGGRGARRPGQRQRREQRGEGEQERSAGGPHAVHGRSVTETWCSPARGVHRAWSGRSGGPRSVQVTGQRHRDAPPLHRRRAGCGDTGPTNGGQR